MEGNRHLGLLILGLILFHNLQESVAIDAPAIVTVENEGNTDSLKVTWTPPADATNHVVTWSSFDGSGSDTSLVLSGTAADYIITGLTPGTLYNVTVTAQNGTDDTSEDSGQGRTKPSPVNPFESGATSNSISAQWTKPSGAIDQYSFSCSDGIEDPSSPIAEDGSNNNMYMASCVGLSTAGADYTITVTSQSGVESSDESTITITAYPNSVVLREGVITTRQITVQWDDPEGEEDSFTVDCGDDGSNDITILPDDATNNNFQATCNVSMAGAPYNITVTSVSGDKESPITGTFTAATPEGVTFGESSSSTTSITVTWDAFAGADGFRVACSEGAPSPSSPLPGSATEVTCDGVTPGGNHSVSVVTLENNGESPATVVYVVALPEAVTLNEESNMVTTTTITASWSKPNGIVEYYEVSCSDGTASPAQVNPSDDLIASCTGLPTPGDNYIISVTSVSNGKHSAASTITITALPEAVTLNEESNMVTTTTITASWTVPNGIVEYYEVSCSAGTASPAQVNPSDDLIASCTGLSTPGDSYTISVTSVSNGKLSAASSITITALPEAVELSPGESNTTAISATWIVPNSVVDTFNITCSDGTASPASILVDSSQGGQQLTAYCVGLPQSGEEYILSVVAISNDKLSAVSTVGVFALPLGVALEEGPSTLTSVSASWMRQNDTVESYSITCSHGDASPSTIEDTDQESFSAACVNLTGPGATYRMTVYSEIGTDSSSNGTRASSLIYLVTVPASVESISVIQYATTTVDVQWNLMQCSDCVYNYFLLTFEPDSQEPIRVDYTTDVNEYSSQVSGLTQGMSYIFTVVSVSGAGVQGATLKTSEKKSVDQRTVPATPFGLSILSSQRELNLVWAYQGDADNFTITITPNHGISVFNGDFTDPAAEVTNLTPGTTYDIAIVTESGDKRSEPITQSARTVPDKPSPVRNPRAEAVDKNTITLTYESPVEPNGDITSYMISYVGTRDGNPTHEFSDVYGVVLTVTYGDLRAGFSYMFTIIAVNDGEFESDRISTAPVETPQEEPPLVEEDYPYEDNTVFTDTSTTSFAVVLPENLFSHDNGELSTFAVIITKEANDPTVGSTEQNYEEARAQNAYITAIDIPYPYPPTFGSNRKRRATESSATVVIGEDGTCACSPKEYCNGALDDNTQYYYAFRAYNSVGDVTSSTFGPVTTESTGSSSPNIMSYGAQIGLIVVVVALLLYAVAITFLHIQFRRKVRTRTEENGPDLYMDLKPRPEVDTTYQEMAITSTASSKKPGERCLPSSHLIYENQHVAQFANKIKGDADYEDVTPN